jgi:5'-nucleotidase
MFVTNGANNAIDVIDISNPTSTSLVKSIDLNTYGTGVNSVAAYNGKVAVATENKSSDGLKTNSKGNVVFFDINGTHLKTVEAGYLPDMVTFNENGSIVIVANEGEPNGDYSVDPEGSIGIINTDDYSYTEITLDMQTTNANDGTLVRLGATPSNSQTKDLEPEYITVLGNYAYVTLQENNALAKVDLTTNTLEFIKSFGAKDYSSKNTIDIEENGTIEMKNYPGLFGLYQPDSIASYSYNNSTYLVTANEGDGREYLYDDKNGEEQESHVDEKKISKLDLDSSIANAYENDNDLKVMIDLGDTDNDGVYEELYTYGARSFSIWDENANLVFDSGDSISKIVAKLEPKLFNQDDKEIDGRSGNKGSEPEALTVGEIDGKTYAFVGLERQSAILVYDISNPKAPKFLESYISHENGDLNPEGMVFVPSSKSPNGKNLLIVSYEGSGSTVVYEIN